MQFYTSNNATRSLLFLSRLHVKQDCQDSLLPATLEEIVSAKWLCQHCAKTAFESNSIRVAS